MTTGPTGADVQAAFCQVLVDEWVRAGISDAVVAPGSRSTPLVLALDRDPRIAVHVVLDERSAGFMALGIGLAGRGPAVVVTTSGTASVELHPAVVEAHQAGVPMVVATTDRPPELHHVGAPQTVEQDGLFGSAVRWQVAPGVADLAASGGWRPLASRCVAEAVAGPAGPGPVHINLAFREPLIGDPSLVEQPASRPGSAPWHRVAERSGAAPAEVVDLLRAHAGGRGLVVAGWMGRGDGDGSILDSARRLGWPVMADPRSGLRSARPELVASADALLRIPQMAARRPDLVVTVGSPWASKVVNQWLAGLGPDVEHVLADPWGRWADPERRATRVVGVAGADLLDAASAGTAVTASSEWMDGWMRAETQAQAVFDELLGEKGDLARSEPGVARSVVAAVPPGGRLVVSSSMPVRDVEWYGRPRSGLAVVANRGANGIDGTLATAIGVAVADGKPTVALVGDLAFLYDAGSLLWASGRDVSLTVVVVDNDGGGIFSFLPQASALPADQFERYWGTPHGTDLVAVARAYGADAVSVSDPAELDEVLSAVGATGVRVVVVRSDRAANVAAHDRLNAEVAQAVTAELAAGR